MSPIDGFQLHHIIPKSLRFHPAFKKSNMNIYNVKNIMYLPTDRKYHPTRSIHEGYNNFHKTYNLEIENQLENILKDPNIKTTQQYEEAIKKVIKEKRRGLRNGKIKLNCKG